jgi:hypothetical protein
MAFAKESDTLGLDEPGVLQFTPKVHRRVRKSSILGKISSALRRA